MDPVTPGKPRGILFYVGAAGLLAIMLIESISVLGRHLQWPLLGSIEMVQAAIVPAACAAMVIASLVGAHATVHLLTDRLAPRPRAWLSRASALLAFSFFAALAAGSAWVTLEYWDTFEQSDVLEIPFRPLRLFVTASMATVALVFLVKAWRGTR